MRSVRAYPLSRGRLPRRPPRIASWRLNIRHSIEWLCAPETMTSRTWWGPGGNLGPSRAWSWPSNQAAGQTVRLDRKPCGLDSVAAVKGRLAAGQLPADAAECMRCPTSRQYHEILTTVTRGSRAKTEVRIPAIITASRRPRHEENDRSRPVGARRGSSLAAASDPDCRRTVPGRVAHWRTE